MPKYKHGSGSIYKRGRVWRLTYSHQGKQVWESAKTTDRAEARRILQAKIGQRAEDRLIVGADRITFEALMKGIEDEYRANERKTLDKIQYRVRHLAKAFAGRRALDIKVTDLRAYIARRQDEGASNAEINRELSVLRRGFNLAR